MRVNGVHASDVIEYLFGPIGAVYSRLGNFSGQSAPDSGVTLVDVDGSSGAIHTHWVVPSLNRTWKRALAGRVSGPVQLVTHWLDLGLPVTYPRPDTIGADRLANACGGVERHGAPLIVADFGTAVTFDVVTRRQGYVGGIIAPGLPLMFSYLHEKTAQLPLIRPARVRGAVGKSTAQAMQAGALWGYRGMVREILRELQRQPALRTARVCATGGYARWIVSGMREKIVVDQDLTLYGIGRIFDLNFGSHGKRT